MENTRSVMTEKDKKDKQNYVLITESELLDAIKLNSDVEKIFTFIRNDNKYCRNISKEALKKAKELGVDYNSYGLNIIDFYLTIINNG